MGCALLCQVKGGGKASGGDLGVGTGGAELDQFEECGEGTLATRIGQLQAHLYVLNNYKSTAFPLPDGPEAFEVDQPGGAADSPRGCSERAHRPSPLRRVPPLWDLGDPGPSCTSDAWVLGRGDCGGIERRRPGIRQPWRPPHWALLQLHRGGFDVRRDPSPAEG